MIPKVNDICGLHSSQDMLQLFDDKTFKIVSGAASSTVFDLSDFAFPVDSNICLAVNVKMNGGEHLLFDNEILSIGSPTSELEVDEMYVRGILLKVTYPVKDNNGEEIDITDKAVELWIEDAETLTYVKHRIYNFFSIFTNPKSNDPRDLINRIKIVNPNELYNVKIEGLIVYGKVQ